MTVANGREFLSIPGPTNIPDAVLQAMHHPAIDIYSGDMIDLTLANLPAPPDLAELALHAAHALAPSPATGLARVSSPDLIGSCFVTRRARCISVVFGCMITRGSPAAIRVCRCAADARVP